jgi:methionine aminopeptidase
MKRLKEIDEHLENACRELDAAVNISEKYGIPFSTNISFISQNYNPKSRSKKYPDLDSDFLESVTGTYGSEDDYGWQHSAVCY